MPDAEGSSGSHQGSRAAVRVATRRPRLSVSRVRVRTNGLRKRGGADTAAVTPVWTRRMRTAQTAPVGWPRGMSADTITRSTRVVHM
ncbi:hypothetical protein GCM10010297_62930 [Streptomyces malachitofuscus]|nr:hypothetical protein GCM10010297_62930 [Streptomyces malachitofuscus]